MTYEQVRSLVLDALYHHDAKQYDAHVWAWLDDQCDNANRLRFAISSRLGYAPQTIRKQ
jgi:hypothetical protein